MFMRNWIAASDREQTQVAPAPEVADAACNEETAKWADCPTCGGVGSIEVQGSGIFFDCEVCSGAGAVELDD